MGGALTGPSVDATASTISTAAITGNGETINSGNIDITVTFSETVNVDTTGGAPTIALKIGSADETASYNADATTALSDATKLVFRYTVPEGDSNVAVGVAATTNIVLNSGTIKDVAGNNAVGTALADYLSAPLTGPTVDTTAPTVNISANPTSLTTEQATTLTFTLSEPAATSGEGTFAVDDITLTSPSGVGDIAIGDLTGVNVITSFSSSTSYTATFSPPPGIRGDVTITVAAGTFTDDAGNDNTAGTVTIAVDTTVPLTLTAGTVAQRDNLEARTDIISAGAGVTIDGNGKVFATFPSSTTHQSVQFKFGSLGWIKGRTGAGTNTDTRGETQVELRRAGTYTNSLIN